VVSPTLRTAAALAFLAAHWFLEFAPVGEAALTGRLAILAAETLLFLWDHRPKPPRAPATP
jgi:hypothetical protein